MLIKTICTTAAAMALLTGAAHAQTAAQPEPAPPPAQTPAATPAASSAGLQVTSSVDASGTTVRTFTNGPVPDTAENRKKFPPLSATGRNTKPQGR
jgi:hypothetical protein